jgi:hypothetical protein
VKIVVLPGATVGDIPAELKGPVLHFVIEEITEAALEDLLRTLTGQPAYPRPPLGTVPALEPLAAGVTAGRDSSTALGIVAKLLIEELEVSVDMINTALREGSYWLATWGLPSRRWQERPNRERIAHERESLDKPVRDAYRKIDEINHCAQRRQAEIQPGAILEDGQGLDLTDGDRAYLRDHLGVIQHAIDTLSGASS